MEYSNNKSGVLFKNDFKQNENQPDYKGSFTDANGEEKDLAGWIRKTKAGKMMLSVKVSDKFVKQDEQAPAASQPDTSDIPF